MKNVDSITLAILLAVITTGAIGAFCDHKITLLKREAVKRNFARYVTDVNGNATFTWREPAPGIETKP